MRLRCGGILEPDCDRLGPPTIPCLPVPHPHPRTLKTQATPSDQANQPAGLPSTRHTRQLCRAQPQAAAAVISSLVRMLSSVAGWCNAGTGSAGDGGTVSFARLDLIMFPMQFLQLKNASSFHKVEPNLSLVHDPSNVRLFRLFRQKKKICSPES
jgi:hypothetical protein